MSRRDEKCSSPFEPGQLGPLRLRNRVIKSATYEGMSPGGEPSSALIEHHVGAARGGVAMTTLAYVAVSPAGRTFEDQIVATPERREGLRRLIDAVHAQGAAVSIQLAHCGSFTKLRGAGMPRGPSYGFNAYGAAHGMPLARPMRVQEIDDVVHDFVRAARVARDAGADAVELHLGHGYLLSQFLSDDPHFERRRYHGFVAYAASKLALLSVTRLLAGRYPLPGPTMNALHPGVVGTALVRSAGLPGRMLGWAMPLLRAPARGAQTPIHLATAPELTGTTGEYFVDGKPRRPSKVATDERLAAEIFELAVELTSARWR